MSEGEVKPEAAITEKTFLKLLDGDFDSAVSFLKENPYDAHGLVKLVIDKTLDKRFQANLISILIERLVESFQEKDKLT